MAAVAILRTAIAVMGTDTIGRAAIAVARDDGLGDGNTRPQHNTRKTEEREHF